MPLKNLIYTLVLATMSLCLNNFAQAQTTSTTNSDSAIRTGFTEVVITTAHPDQWINFLTQHGGWEVRNRSDIPDGMSALWNISDKTKGETYLLANKGSNSGFIRLTKLDNVTQAHIRADDRPWDTGGIFDFNMRVIGLYDLRNKLLTEGWQGDSEPIQYVFGPFEVIEWIARGPDGVRIAFIERLKPALEGWPNLKSLSRVFNSTTIVKDMKTSRDFFKNVLGMKTYLVSNKPSDEPGPNVLGLPHNIATMVSRDVAILHPDGTNEGSIELVQFVGATGADFSARAKPHNLGISALRFPVDNLDRSLRKLQEMDVSIKAAPVEMPLFPYGDIQIAGIETPDGVRLELFEVMKQE